MSDRSQPENDDSIEVHQDSAPSSPYNLSSPAEHPLDLSGSDHSPSSNSSEFEISDRSSPQYCQGSPSSSPVKRGKKRPSYGAYKDDPTIPVRTAASVENCRCCVNGIC